MFCSVSRQLETGSFTYYPWISPTVLFSYMQSFGVLFISLSLKYSFEFVFFVLTLFGFFPLCVRCWYVLPVTTFLLYSFLMYCSGIPLVFGLFRLWFFGLMVGLPPPSFIHSFVVCFDCCQTRIIGDVDDCQGSVCNALDGDRYLRRSSSSPPPLSLLCVVVIFCFFGQTKKYSSCLVLVLNSYGGSTAVFLSL